MKFNPKISNLAVGTLTDATDPKYLDRNQTSRFYTDRLKFISNLKSRNGLYSNQQTS